MTSEPSDPSATGAPLEPAFATITLQGSGNKIPKFKIPVDEPAIATITYTGRSNFVVWSLAGDGSENDLLVNVIGKYKGTVLFDIDFDEHSVAMRVESSGSWRIVIKPIEKARTWPVGSTVTGTGDDVLLMLGPDGLVTSLIKYRGSSNFAVWAYSADDTDLLVNEIGRYDGEVQFVPDAVLVAVESEGSWSMTWPE